MTRLDQRSQILLKSLVEHYIAEGQPVGSRALSRHSGLNLSPATVRGIAREVAAAGAAGRENAAVTVQLHPQPLRQGGQNGLIEPKRPSGLIRR